MLVTRYPNPTTQESWDLLNATNVRLDKVWSGVKEALGYDLPGMVNFYNTKNARTGGNKLQCPTSYFTAGQDLDDNALPAVFVGCSSELTMLCPGVPMSENPTAVWVATKASVSKEDLVNASVLCHLVMGALLPYQGGYRNVWNQCLWNYLQPSGIQPVPKAEGDLYGGFYFTCQIGQGPMDGAFPIYETPNLAP